MHRGACRARARGEVVSGDHRLRRCAVCDGTARWRKTRSIQAEHFLDSAEGWAARARAGTAAELPDVPEGKVYGSVVYECVERVAKRMDIPAVGSGSGQERPQPVSPWSATSKAPVERDVDGSKAEAGEQRRPGATRARARRGACASAILFALFFRGLPAFGRRALRARLVRTKEDEATG